MNELRINCSVIALRNRAEGTVAGKLTKCMIINSVCKRARLLMVIKKAALLLGKFRISPEYADKESRELFDLTVGTRVITKQACENYPAVCVLHIYKRRGVIAISVAPMAFRGAAKRKCNSGKSMSGKERGKERGTPPLSILTVLFIPLSSPLFPRRPYHPTSTELNSLRDIRVTSAPTRRHETATTCLDVWLTGSETCLFALRGVRRAKCMESSATYRRFPPSPSPSKGKRKLPPSAFASRPAVK